MAAGQWYFSKERLENSPSRKCGIDADKELSYRQQAANFIQDIGQSLNVTQFCIETAIVCMLRFYVFHSFSKFHQYAISMCSLFLAAKLEYQPRRLQDVIKCAHVRLCENVPFDIKSQLYLQQFQELIANENIMLPTLGFDLTVDHLYTHVVKCCQLVRASKDLAQASYTMATISLHLTMMSLQYPPTVVTCVCVHLACKWTNWEIPITTEGKVWYWYVDQTVTKQLLDELTSEFLAILEKCPSRLKRKLSGGKELQPCEKRMKSEVPVSMSIFAVPNNEKAHTHQKDKRQVATASRCLKDVPSPATSKGIPSHHSKSSTTHNKAVSSLIKLPVSATQKPLPSRCSKEGSHSIGIADYKENHKQKVKGHGKTSNYNFSQSHSVPLNSNKSGKEEKLDYLQNLKDRDTSDHHKVVHPKHAENNLLVNCEQQPIELTNTKENLQRKMVDDARQISGNRVVNSDRVEPAVTGTWYEKVKTESSHSKHQELPLNPLSHQGKNSARSLTVTQGTQRTHYQDTRLMHGSDVLSEHVQTNTANEETPSQIKVNKTKHQKHRIVPAVIPTSLPQDDLPGHDWNARRILVESKNTDNLKTDAIPVTHKSESDHSKRIDASFNKVGELHSRQERQKKHKHSSLSSDREKTSVNTDQVSSASLSLSAGLKLTIPKKKLCGSLTQMTNTSSSARDALKTKIDGRKIANNNSSNSIKLLIKRDKTQNTCTVISGLQPSKIRVRA